MAQPPIQSVVLKTATPTPAQTTQIRAVKAAAVPNTWSASTDPIVGAGPSGTGLHMTRSGRYVNAAGFYAGGVTPLSQAAAAQSRSGPAPVKTNARGFVASPIGGLKGGAVASPKVAPVKVTVHPNGKIVVHSTPAAAPASPVSAAASAAPAQTATPVKAKPVVTRQATATTPAAPVQTVEQQAHALLDPVVQSSTDAINTRIAAQQAAINSSAQTLADLMGKYAPASKAAYGGAEVGQAAVDSALGGTLSGQGQAGQDALAAQLAKINADPGTTARLEGTAAANTTGATGALAARGSSSLSNLIAQNTSAQDYGSKLPGVAGMYGLQSTKAAQTQGTTDIANATAALEAKYPDLVNQIKTTNNQQKQLAFENKLAGYKNTVAQTNATTAQTKASNAAAAATAKQTRAAGKVDLPLSKTYGILVNANAEPILRGGKTVPVPGSTTGGLSVKDFTKYQSLAKAGAITAHNGGTDAKGNVLPPISWLQYRQHGLSAGIPEAILIAVGKTVYSPREIKLGLIPGQGSDRGK